MVKNTIRIFAGWDSTIKMQTCYFRTKYTESINKTDICQALGYLGSYLRLKQFKPEKVCAFIVRSKTPQKRDLKQIGFELTNV